MILLLLVPFEIKNKTFILDVAGIINKVFLIVNSFVSPASIPTLSAKILLKFHFQKVEAS